MNEINTTNEKQTQAVRREVLINGTVYNVTSIYQGGRKLDEVLLDWAIDKALQAS